jgi:hypothetical protein
MKFLLIFFLSAFYIGCTVRRNSVPVEEKTTSKPPAEETSSSNISKGVMWDLLTGEQITLQLKNLDDGSKLSVTVSSGVSVHQIKPGHWELTGYEENGRSYTSMNTSKKFIIRIRSKGLVYAGSIIVRCPSITTKDFKLLKSMKFFNRYPFSGNIGLCEMVVGNDLSNVRMKLKNKSKLKKLNIGMGF